MTLSSRAAKGAFERLGPDGVAAATGEHPRHAEGPAKRAGAASIDRRAAPSLASGTAAQMPAPPGDAGGPAASSPAQRIDRRERRNAFSIFPRLAG